MGAWLVGMEVEGKELGGGVFSDMGMGEVVCAWTINEPHLPYNVHVGLGSGGVVVGYSVVLICDVWLSQHAAPQSKVDANFLKADYPSHTEL